jgi:23S rRNA (guanosine2251-2'-O)-methyltransferase
MRKLKNDELDRMTVEEFKTSEKLPLVLVLDNVRSMNNVGSAFRTGDAFAIEKVYLCGITAQPPHREINKTALGATESVEWEYAEDTASLCLKLQSLGYQVLAVEQAEGSLSLEKFQILTGQKYALVFGNEVFGVDDGVVQLADACLEIPQFGTKHSLNISVSIGVVLWDLTSKIKFD